MNSIKIKLTELKTSFARSILNRWFISRKQNKTKNSKNKQETKSRLKKWTIDFDKGLSKEIKMAKKHHGGIGKRKFKLL